MVVKEKRGGVNFGKVKALYSVQCVPWILRKASPEKKSNPRPGCCTAGCMEFWLGLAAGWLFWAEFGALVVGGGAGKRVREKRSKKNPPPMLSGGLGEFRLMLNSVRA